MAAQSGLKGYGKLISRHTGARHEGSHCLETLCAIARRMRRARRLATGFSGQTMMTCGIGLADLSFRNAVKTKKKMVESFSQVRLGCCDKRVNVNRMIEVGRLHADFPHGSEPGRHFFHALDGRF